MIQNWVPPVCVSSADQPKMQDRRVGATKRRDLACKNGNRLQLTGAITPELLAVITGTLLA